MFGFGPKLSNSQRSIVSVNLQCLRRTTSFSQAKMAAVLGISNAAYKNYESGTRDLPLAVAVTISDTFDVSLDDFILNKGNWTWLGGFESPKNSRDDNSQISRDEGLPMSLAALDAEQYRERIGATKTSRLNDLAAGELTPR